MSGRIRSIKPEWIDSELFCSCSDAAIRLSFVFFALVDDDGRVRISVRALGLRTWAFCEDVADKTAHTRAALSQLVRVGWLEEYEVDGVACWQVRNWAKHQKIDKYRPSKLPPPPIREDSRDVAESSRGVARSREESPNAENINDSVRSRGVATIREESRGVAPDLDLDLDQEVDPDLEHVRTRATVTPLPVNTRGKVIRAFQVRWEAEHRSIWPGVNGDPNADKVARWIDQQAEHSGLITEAVIERVLTNWWSDEWVKSHNHPWKHFAKVAGEFWNAKPQQQRKHGPAPVRTAAEFAAEIAENGAETNEF